MEAEERPSKMPRLETEVEAQNGSAALSPSPPRDAAIAASVPHLPPSEAEGTHAMGLQDAGEGRDALDARSRPVPDVNATAAATTAVTGSTMASDEMANLSKSARKRLLKRQAWEAQRPARQVARRAKHAARKEKARMARSEAAAAAAAAAGESQDQSQGQGQGQEASTRTRSSKARGGRHSRALAAPLPVGIVLDCGFDSLMTEQEIVSLGNQVTRCYSDNAGAAPRHARLVVAGLDGRLQQRFDGLLRGVHRNWRGIEVRTEPLPEVLATMSFAAASATAAEKLLASSSLTSSSSPSSQPAPHSPSPWSAPLPPPPTPPNADGTLSVARTVYLTADAETTLTELKPYETYIIGALVDRNRHKGICAQRAKDLGIPTAKLPLAEYLTMPSRKVLATNHVVEIMLRWLQGEGWAKALDHVMPKRKGAVVKGSKGDDGDGDGNEAEDGDEDDARTEDRREEAKIDVEMDADVDIEEEEAERKVPEPDPAGATTSTYTDNGGEPAPAITTTSMA